MNLSVNSAASETIFSKSSNERDPTWRPMLLIKSESPVGQKVHAKLQALEGSTKRTYGVANGATPPMSVRISLLRVPIMAFKM